MLDISDNKNTNRVQSEPISGSGFFNDREEGCQEAVVDHHRNVIAAKGVESEDGDTLEC